MNGTEISNDFDQSETLSQQSPGKQQPAAETLDDSIAAHEAYVVAAKKAAAAILMRIEEELAQLDERRVELLAKRDRIGGLRPVGPDEPSRLTRANGTSTRIRPNGKAADEHPVDKVVGRKARAVKPTLAKSEVDALLASGMPKRDRKAVKRAAKSLTRKREKPVEGLSLSARFVAAVYEAPKQNNAHYADLLGIPQQRAASLANALKRAGKLKRHGKGKAITWTVA
jgi:hypothetical protein